MLTASARGDTFARVRRRVLVIDNYDSFTYNLVQYLEELGASCSVELNDRTTIEEIRARTPHGVVLSPGPGTPDDAGITLSAIAALAGEIPLLGVCLGHQAIAAHFGGTVRRALRPVHGEATPVEHVGDGIFGDLPSPFSAARYHSLVVDPTTLPACLAQTARTAEGELMGLRHRELPIEGIQFHPESVLSEHGHALLGNWLSSL